MSPCPEVLAIPKISGGREKSLVPSGLIRKDDRLWADIVTGQWLRAILSPLVRRASWSYFCPNTIECTRNPGLILGSNNSGALFCRYLFLGWWDSVQCACGLRLALSKARSKDGSGSLARRWIVISPAGQLYSDDDMMAPLFAVHASRVVFFGLRMGIVNNQLNQPENSDGGSHCSRMTKRWPNKDCRLCSPGARCELGNCCKSSWKILHFITFQQFST